MKIEIELPEIEGFEYTGEYRKAESKEWYLDAKNKIDHNPNSLSTCYDYLILEKLKPATLEDRVKAEYADFDVVMCEPVAWHGVDFIGFKRGEKHWSTFEAQGMIGHEGYIYKKETHFDGITFEVDCRPTCYVTSKIELPIAVLFTRAGE